jgi:hypothetical protein
LVRWLFSRKLKRKFAIISVSVNLTNELDMAMYNIPVARKVCATCKWWRAERELEFSGAREPRYRRIWS